MNWIKLRNENVSLRRWVTSRY